MSEHDLRTALRDQLSHAEPPLPPSAGAVRTGARQRHRRLALGGGAAAVAAVAFAVAVLPQHPGGTATKHDAIAADHSTTPAPAPAATGSLEDQIAAAAQQLDQYVGGLGQPTWLVNDVNGRHTELQDPDTQFVRAQYHPAGTPQLDVDVSGVNVGQLAGAFGCAPMPNTYVSCSSKTLQDGTNLTTIVQPHQDTLSASQPLPTVSWAEAHPDQVSWVRTVVAKTKDGTVVGAAEYVHALTPDAAQWSVPVAALEAVATDPTLLAGGGIAHKPFDAPGNK